LPYSSNVPNPEVGAVSVEVAMVSDKDGLLSKVDRS